MSFTVLPLVTFYQENPTRMKQSITIECPHCQCDDLVKNGHSEHGTQRYRCKQCRRSVQWDSRYTAWAPGTKEHIPEQTLNGSGVRDISRNLGIAKHTVMAEVKKNAFGRELRFCRTTQQDALE